jgi:hypothetical protein
VEEGRVHHRPKVRQRQRRRNSSNVVVDDVPAVEPVRVHARAAAVRRDHWTTANGVPLFGLAERYFLQSQAGDRVPAQHENVRWLFGALPYVVRSADVSSFAFTDTYVPILLQLHSIELVVRRFGIAAQASHVQAREAATHTHAVPDAGADTLDADVQFVPHPANLDLCLQRNVRMQCRQLFAARHGPAQLQLPNNGPGPVEFELPGHH